MEKRQVVITKQSRYGRSEVVSTGHNPTYVAEGDYSRADIKQKD